MNTALLIAVGIAGALAGSIATIFALWAMCEPIMR